MIMILSTEPVMLETEDLTLKAGEFGMFISHKRIEIRYRWADILRIFKRDTEDRYTLVIGDFEIYLHDSKTGDGVTYSTIMDTLQKHLNKYDDPNYYDDIGE